MTIWDKKIALSHIEKHFNYLNKGDIVVLFEDFPKAFDNFAIILQLPDYRIRYTRDRSTITMQLGTNQASLDWSMDGWHELITIILYLTQKQFLMMVGYGDDRLDADKQLEKLSKVFHYYHDQIVELFKMDYVSKEEENLHLVAKYMQEVIAGNRKKQDYDRLIEQSKKYWEVINKNWSS